MFARFIPSNRYVGVVLLVRLRLQLSYLLNLSTSYSLNLTKIVYTVILSETYSAFFSYLNKYLLYVLLYKFFEKISLRRKPYLSIRMQKR